MVQPQILCPEFRYRVGNRTAKELEANIVRLYEARGGSTESLMGSRTGPLMDRRKTLEIRDMTRESAIELLHSVHTGRIACVSDSQPYITPLHFAYQDHFIYSFGTVGKRIRWMRANPKVCVEIEKLESRERWQTIVIFGDYEELPDNSECLGLQILAYDLLSKAANWWEPGFAETFRGDVARPLEIVYFRVKITEMSSHVATARDTPAA